MVIASILLMLHALLNLLLSREIYYWIPGTREQVRCYLVLWLLPVAGVILTWRAVRPQWFSREPDENGAHSTLSSGLLALDAIFNPGSVHVLDAQKRSEITIRMEGEMYDRELPDFVEISDNAAAEKSPEE